MTFQRSHAHRFGSDKPDLRVKLEFTELTERDEADVDFKVFSGAATMKNGRVVAPARARRLGAEGGRHQRVAKSMPTTEFVKIYGAKGLAYIKRQRPCQAAGRNGLQSPIVKNIHDKARWQRVAGPHRRAKWRPDLLWCR